MILGEIEAYIENNLSGEMRQTALNFAEFLRTNGLTFYRDTCDCWKDKIYYWAKYDDGCVCYIAIKDPDEPHNLWTVWSDESKAYENALVSDEIKNIGWRHVDICGHCGSCAGGKRKTVFGKAFDGVCGCTFRIDNPTEKEIPFLKQMVIIRKNEIAKFNM